MTGLSRRERALVASGVARFAGVDEAGRGPLAGPVVAAAVMFAPSIRIEGVHDSKQLTANERAELAERIRASAESWAIGVAEPEEIDRVNILQASIIAMHRAIEALQPRPELLLVDGNQFHHPALPFETIVRGDATCFSIAAASILAKEHRDCIMTQLAVVYPQYDFASNKGYPTPGHIEAIRLHGTSPVHRRSFTVRQLSPQLAIFDRHEFES